MNSPGPVSRLSSTHDSMTAFRQAFDPGVRRGERQAPDPLGMPERQLLGDQAAQRMPDDMSRRQAERVEPAGHVVGQVGRRVRLPARSLRPASRVSSARARYRVPKGRDRHARTPGGRPRAR